MIPLILTGLLRVLRTRQSLVLENLALRHQLVVLQRTARRPRLRTADRLLWVLLSRLWRGWADAVSVVQPATVIRWQRTGFKLFWTWKSRRHGPGRPAVAPEVRALIRRMSQREPPLGRAADSRGAAEVGHRDFRRRRCPSTWSRPEGPRRKPGARSSTNHVRSLVSVDFFTVPTVTFKMLFVFVVLAHHRRRVVHFNVTEPPRPVDGPADRGGVPLGDRPAISPARPRCGLRRRVLEPSASHGDRRRQDGASVARGRIRTWNGSSGPCAASASTTSWC